MISKRCATALVAILFLGLSACGDPSSMITMAQFAGFPETNQWTEAKVLKLGWISAPLQRTEPIYCYSTLARPVCYSWPVKGQESRLVGYLGPAPF